MQRPVCTVVPQPSFRRCAPLRCRSAGGRADEKSLEGIGIQLLDQLVAGQGAVYSQSRDKVLCFHGEAPCETLLPEEFARRYGFERSEREYDGFQHQAAEDCFPADDPFSWGGSSDLY